MAPIHHHFEALGWQESKIIARFWIAGLVMALFALTTSEAEVAKNLNLRGKDVLVVGIEALGA